MKRDRTKLYLYCITKSSRVISLDMKGIDGNPVRLVKSGGLSAVVTDARTSEYSFSRRNLVNHQTVIDKTHRITKSAIPFSFGTVAESEQELKQRIMDPKQKELLRILESIQDKVEIEVKFIWKDLKEVAREIAQKDAQLTALDATFARKAVNVDEAVYIGKLVEKGLQLERERIKRAVLEEISPLADLHKEAPRYYDEMVLHLLLLVPDTQVAASNNLLKQLASRLDGGNISVAVSEPMAPYDFVKVPVPLD